MSVIFGISGEKFSGKDTVADAIVSRYAREGKKAKIIRFAEPLKQSLCTLFGWDRSQLESHEFKETPEPITGKTPRYIMQAMGTEFGRELLHDEVWIRLAAAEVERCLKDDTVPVLSDVRFENEASMVREMGGVLVHVINPENVIRTDAHASENGVAQRPHDLRFINDKSKGMIPVYQFVDVLVNAQKGN